MFLKRLFFVFITLCFSFTCFAHMKPHQMPEKGPWFEGWYTRITDSSHGDSIAVIVSSYFFEQKGEKIPGYIAIIHHVVDRSETTVFEAFPEHTIMINNSDDSLFRWEAPGFGYITKNEINISIPNEISVKANIIFRTPWFTKEDYDGPEGRMSNWSWLSQHWYVYSLLSEAHYEISYNDDSNIDYFGKGWAHQEKNWGTVFPKAWIWLQGFSPDGKRSISVAGGKAQIKSIELESWLAAYDSPKMNCRFRQSTLGNRFKWKINPCNRTYKLEAVNLKCRLEIFASAEKSSFVKLSVPTIEGYIEGAEESFATKIDVKLYKYSLEDSILNTKTNLIDSYTFYNSALEFGGEYYCPQ